MYLESYTHAFKEAPHPNTITDIIFMFYNERLSMDTKNRGPKFRWCLDKLVQTMSQIYQQLINSMTKTQ